MFVPSVLNKAWLQLKLLSIQRPLELILLAGVGVLSLSSSYGLDDIYLGFLLFVPIIFAIFYLLRRQTWCYWLSPFVMAAVLYWLFQHYGGDFFFYEQTPEYWGALCIALIWFLSEGWHKDNRRYVFSVIEKSLNLLIFSPFMGYLCFMAVMGIIWSVDYLFNLQLPFGDIWGRGFAFTFFCVIPLFFLLIEQNQLQRQGTLHYLVEVIINVILSPALIIYSLILYAYLAMILFTAELPRGNVSWMVLPYLFAAIGLSALQAILQKPRWQRFYRVQPYILLAPLVLLWLGIVERISTYSFTTMRVYLSAVAVTVTLFCLLSLSKTRLQYRYLAFIGIAVIFITTYIINPKKIEFDSQSVRLEQDLAALNMLDSAGKIKPHNELVKMYGQATDVEKAKVNSLSVLAFRLYKWDATIATKYGESEFTDFMRSSYHAEIEHDTEHHRDFKADMRTIDPKGYQRITVFNFDHYITRISADNKILPQEQISTELNVTFDGNQFIRHVLQKNGFELNKEYSQEQLDVLREQFTQADIPEGRLLFSRFVMSFDEEQGYLFDEAAIIMFLEK